MSAAGVVPGLSVLHWPAVRAIDCSWRSCGHAACFLRAHCEILPRSAEPYRESNAGLRDLPPGTSVDSAVAYLKRTGVNYMVTDSPAR